MLGSADNLPLFTYGTLLDEEFTSRLLEHPVVTEPARLLDHETVELSGLSYPALVAAEGRFVEGRLYRQLSAADYERLDAYEGVAEGLYRRVVVHAVVLAENEPRPPERAYVYLPTEKTLLRYPRRGLGPAAFD